MDSTPQHTDSAPAVTTEMVKAEIKLELSKTGTIYQTVLQKAENIKFDKDKLDADYAPLKELRAVVKQLKDKENPYTAAWQAWNSGRKDLLDPLNELLIKKTAEFKKLSDEVAAENEKIKKEEEDKIAKTELINNTILDFSAKIAAAATDKGIVTLEKAMGTEKSRKNTYGDYLPDLIARIDELKPIVAAKKEAIRNLGGLEKEAETALNEGDDVKLESVETQKEETAAKVSELGTKIQETAIAGTRYYGGYSKVAAPAPKPRRITCEWQIEDMALFAKKHPEWVEIVAKQGLVDEYVKTRKGELSDSTPEIRIDGLKIYRKSHY